MRGRAAQGHEDMAFDEEIREHIALLEECYKGPDRRFRPLP